MTLTSSIAAWLPTPPSLNQLLFSIVLAVPLAFLLHHYLGPSTSTPANEDDEPYRQRKTPASSAMAAPHPDTLQSPAVHLNAPKFDLYTQAELAKFDGAGGGNIYVAVKGIRLALTDCLLSLTIICSPGTIFDVSAKKDMYGPGGELLICLFLSTMY